MEAIYGMDKTHKSIKVCLTPGCVKAAANLLKSITTDVDPCTDFYEFAWGNYIEKTMSPEYFTEKDHFNDAR